MIKKKISLVFVLLLCSLGGDLFASKPRLSRDGKTCEQILSELSHSPERAALANNSFVPLSVLLSSNKCKMVAKNWREGPYHSKTLPTPGLLEMFRTADEASADLIEKLGLKGIESPVYDKRSPLEGAAATLEMMERKNPPKYIRSGVLFREGVFTVVPLLMLMEPSGVYAPLVAKGHQDLNREDIYTAAFTAWALEPWIGQTPEKAFIHLVPMVAKRKTSQPSESESTFSINPSQYFPIIKEVYEDFVSTVSSPKKLEEIEPRRCTECNRCPWANYCRGLMKEKHDLSMIPLPPTKLQSEVFKSSGYLDLVALSRLNINSAEFILLALRSGLSTSRLRYMVAHAKSVVSGKPLRTGEYQDPFEGKKTVVHIDFEDVMDSGIKSGVYLFGVETQRLSDAESRARKKRFFFASELSQQAIDLAWADFIRFIQKDLGMDKGDWAVTMYSKHEVVKFEQQFDIVRAPASEFSAFQKKSDYYSEVGVGEKAQGRLIRRKDFFETHKDLTPSDIFKILDHSVDLLDYTRHALAFPTYSNGIKHILPYVRTKREPLAYPEGANGLESMAWAREAYARNEKAYFEKAQDYNEIDIDANRLVSDFVRSHADLPMARQLKWSKLMATKIESIDYAVKQRAFVSQLLNKKALLEKAAHKGLKKWTIEEIQELSLILDRSDYLAKRTEITEIPRQDPRLKNARLQKLQFEYMAGRQSKVHDFFVKLNPELSHENAEPNAHKAFVEILQAPAQLLGPKHLNQLLLLGELQKKFAKVKWKPKTSFESKLELTSDELLHVEADEDLKMYAKELGLSISELKTMWQGLYFLHAFPAVGGRGV